MQVTCTLLRSGAKIPTYQTPGSSGADLYAANEEPIIIKAQNRALIMTGIALEIPPGYEAQVRPRSGLALKFGIGMVNAPGTIDADYRGEIGVILLNTSMEDFIINPGDRIAQLVIAPVIQAQFMQSPFLNETNRGSGGFGSTGV